jgi:hypothetical protein
VPAELVGIVISKVLVVTLAISKVLSSKSVVAYPEPVGTVTESNVTYLPFDKP